MKTVLLASVVMVSSVALAKKPALECGVDEHASGGHCCRAGEDWVPAKRRCICFEAACQKPQPPKVDGREVALATIAVIGAVADTVDIEVQVSRLRALKDDWKRLAYVQQNLNDRRFSCAQIRRLMLTAQFDVLRIEIAAALFPMATDPQNRNELLGALAFEESRPDLLQRLR